MTKSVRAMKETKFFSANNYHPLPVVMTSGSGVWLTDVEGNTYLDMFSAYSAENFGQCHPHIVSALINQARRLGTVSRGVYTDVYAQFVRAIDELCYMDKILPANGGAEAVETAIKLARKWGYEKKEGIGETAEIISCCKNFHGRSFGVLSASDDVNNKKNFGPFLDGFKYIPFNNLGALGQAITKNTVGFLVESIQGEGGINIPSEGYFKAVEKICHENNVLLMIDEIQTGFGRTGHNFAYEYEGVRPDVLILGKALGGGMMPVSAVLSRRDIMEVIRPGDHGSTFGGNPLACAVGIAAIELLDQVNLASRARELGDYFMGELRKVKSPFIKEIRGRGLMIGLELEDSPNVGRLFSEAMLRKGVLCKDTRNNVIRLTPPLIIKKSEIDWALEAMEKVLRSWDRDQCH
ncbi:MAG TPA: ornithine--oxo-acid transaminase [Candidatus Paceibacterota bacterium]